MSHRTRIRPNIGAWALNSAVTPAEFDAFDAAQFAAMDGDAGGIWSPSSKIIIGGTQGQDVVAPFRALGSSGFIASMQAQNWPERSSISSTVPVNSVLALAWLPASGFASGPVFSAFGTDGVPLSSEDGLLWTAHSTLGASINDLAAGVIGGSASFLATKLGAGYYKSTDGITWVSAGSVPAVPHGVACYASGLGLWVIAGDGGLVYTSPDGAAWTPRTTPAGWIAGCGGAARIAWSGSLFVVIPSSVYGNFLTSPDGVTWTERTVGATAWTGLAYGSYDGLWIAVGAGSNLASSSDGITWVFSASATFVGANDLSVNNSLWIAPTIVGTKGGITWSVDRGNTWQTTAVGNHRIATAGFTRLISAGNRFIAAHATGTAIEFALSLRSS